tara:strand:- start:700 stop:963 length:264 start_codon:yes stop_codon:yes gene_type:complete
LIAALRATNNSLKVVYLPLLPWGLSFGAMALTSNILSYDKGYFQTISIASGLSVYAYFMYLMIKLGNNKTWSSRGQDLDGEGREGGE